MVDLFDKRAFPRGQKPCQFTALIGAAEAAPFQTKRKLTHYRAFGSGSLAGATIVRIKKEIQPSDERAPGISSELQ